MTTEIISTLVATALLVLFLYKILKKAKKKRGEDSNIVIIWWFVVLFSGFTLHLYASLQIPKDETQTLISYLLSSIGTSTKSSLKMFAYDFYYGEVKQIADSNSLYSIAITVCYFAAIIWTTLMAAKIFFPGITNGIKVLQRAKFPQGKNDCHYIIIGCEKSMLTFLDDLLEKKARKKNITIITGIPIKNGDDSTIHFKKFIENGYAVINGKADEVALKKAGIDNTKRRTRVIAITECDEQNLTVADIITKKISSVVEKNTDAESRQKIIDNINLEAYIMYSFIERAEHFVFAEDAFGKIDFFNPYELRARNFFWKYPITSLIPANFIDTDKARLKKKYIIKNIFIGFGNANYQMLKGSILTGQLLGCDYNATIYDENICGDKPSIRQAMFMNHSSGLFDEGETMKGEKYFSSPDEKYNINFKNGNTLSRDFYTKADNCLMKEIKDNDFTVIYVALGEDQLSVETACEIRQCLYEHGITQDKIRIFVKISEESVFNRDSVINNPQNNPIKIECFGLNSDILTKDNIMNESLDGFAKMVTNRNHDTPWMFLTETKRDMNRQVAMIVKTKLNLLGFDLVKKEESEEKIKAVDYYKAYKRDSNDKISKIIELSKEFADCKNKKEKLFMYILDYVEQTNGAISDTPRNNLARLEHLRWNTFHLIHGWTKMPEKKIGAGNSGRQNKLTKQHACITTFEELIKLRELQAKKMREKDPTLSEEEAIAKEDTIWYDYNLMDELPVRLLNSGKSIILNVENKDLTVH